LASFTGGLPQAFCGRERIDFALQPPCFFIAALVQVSVVSSAERHGKLVARFRAERAWLSVTNVMRIAWLSTANKAGLA